MKLSGSLLLAAALASVTAIGPASGIAIAADNQITILYDAFGKDASDSLVTPQAQLVERVFVERRLSVAVNPAIGRGDRPRPARVRTDRSAAVRANRSGERRGPAGRWTI